MNLVSTSKYIPILRFKHTRQLGCCSSCLSAPAPCVLSRRRLSRDSVAKADWRPTLLGRTPTVPLLPPNPALDPHFFTTSTFTTNTTAALAAPHDLR